MKYLRECGWVTKAARQVIGIAASLARSVLQPAFAYDLANTALAAMLTCAEFPQWLVLMPRESY
jgi:hypothetical protein